jgi:FkbM family methyltransferase
MRLRSIAERCARNVRLRRRLPRAFGGRPIWVSPDARLRFLRPGAAAFDLELLHIARRLISPGQVVIDVGANVGEFALAASHFAEAKGAVLAIEPDPFLCALLHRTIAEPDNAGMELDALCAGVADRDGFAGFQVASRGRAANALAGHGLPAMGHVRSRFIAPVFTLDTIADRWRAPDLIKIDVEGAELRVLEGAGRTLRQHRPLILLEVTSNEEDVRALLTHCDYKLFAPSAEGAPVAITQCEFNTLAVPAEKVPALIGR